MRLDHLSCVPESDMHGRYIFEATRAGLWPFKPRMIQTWTDYDIDFHGVVIFVEAFFGDKRIIKRQTVDAFDLADDSYKAVYDVSWKFFHDFRNRETYRSPDNIVLGEN